MDRRFDQLKKALFDWGTDYIEEFIGYGMTCGKEKDEIEELMNEAYDQMPDDILEEFYKKFCIE